MRYGSCRCEPDVGRIMSKCRAELWETISHRHDDDEEWLWRLRALTSPLEKIADDNQQIWDFWLVLVVTHCMTLNNPTILELIFIHLCIRTYCCCDKLQQTYWPKTMKIDYLTILKFGSLNGPVRLCFFWRHSERICFFPFLSSKSCLMSWPMGPSSSIFKASRTASSNLSLILTLLPPSFVITLGPPKESRIIS